MADPIPEPADQETVDRVLGILAQGGEMYDVLRIVDPVAHKVTEHVADRATPPPYRCQGFWSPEPACPDCLTSRAFRENRRMNRIRFHKGRIYLNVAIPVPVGGRGVVVELLKDLTGSLVTMGGNNVEAGELQTLFDQIEMGASTDPLTGLLDRRTLDIRLPRELARARSTRYPLSLVLLSIDDLVPIRSRYGEVVADEAVLAVAELLKASMRSEQDWVARSADGMFLVVMRNTGHSGLHTVAERLRVRTGRIGIQHAGHSVPVSASLAVHIEMPTQPSNGPLLQILEKKVQEAGFAGGDRIV